MLLNLNIVKNLPSGIKIGAGYAGGTVHSCESSVYVDCVFGSSLIKENYPA